MFNFLEINMYLGGNMLLDEEDEALKNTDNIGMQMGCNKKSNAHNDLCYSDDGVQSIDDSADPQLSTATFTVGSSKANF